MIVIPMQVIRGTTSHFNDSTPFDALVWTAMAGAIVAVWLASLVTAIVLIRNPGPDPARNAAVVIGVVLSLLGMALGFLMTLPSAAQIQSGSGIYGAHTVGLADGGPGLPFLGWSTTGGDLRIPHFVGMHALQVIPLVLIGLELLSRRVPRLRDALVRRRLILLTGALYLVVVGIITWQALRGQSIVHPDQLTLTVTGVLLAAAVAAAAVVILRPGVPRRRLSANPG